jgi:hypothetical protein
MTRICLHNPGHNGDILFSLQIVNLIIKENPDFHFVLSASCSSILYKQFLSSNVEYIDHPTPWVISTNKQNEYKDNLSRHISDQHDTLYSFHNDVIFINLWSLMVKDNYTCCDISTRIPVIKHLFENIEKETHIKLKFNIDDYKQLIPEIPQLDIRFLLDRISGIVAERGIMYDKKIFYYNFQNLSASNFHDGFDEERLTELLKDDVLVIVPDTCKIKHKNLISLMDDCGIYKEQDGRSIVLYANYTNLCDIVYFKNNGGSLFHLNTVNISNKKTKYVYLHGHDSYYHVFKNVYGLNLE